jgi:hypothetical protein
MCYGRLIRGRHACNPRISRSVALGGELRPCVVIGAVPIRYATDTVDDRRRESFLDLLERLRRGVFPEGEQVRIDGPVGREGDWVYA